MRFAKELLLALLMAISACAPSIKSVIGENVGKKVYANTLIVIPYVNPAAEEPSKKLKHNLELLFNADGHKVEIIVFEQKQEELKLNPTMEINSTLNERVRKDEKDLILVFRTKTISVQSGAMMAITFMVAATDVSLGKEIWKAECVNDNFFGPSDFGKKTAAVIYSRLKADKVL